MPSAWCFSLSAGNPTRDNKAVSQRDADLQFGFELNWDVEFDFPCSSECKSDFTCVSSCALPLVLSESEFHFDVASPCELAFFLFSLSSECDFGFFFSFSSVFDSAFAFKCEPAFALLCEFEFEFDFAGELGSVFSLECDLASAWLCDSDSGFDSAWLRSASLCNAKFELALFWKQWRFVSSCVCDARARLLLCSVLMHVRRSVPQLHSFRLRLSVPLGMCDARAHFLLCSVLVHMRRSVPHFCSL